MNAFKRDFQKAFCGVRDVATTRRLNPTVYSFETWLAEHKHRIPIE